MSPIARRWIDSFVVTSKVFSTSFLLRVSEKSIFQGFSLFTEEPVAKREVNAEPGFIKECRNTYPSPRGSKEDLARCDVIYFSVSGLPYTYISQEWRTCFTSFRVPFCFDSSRFTYIHQSYFTGTVIIIRLSWCQWSNPDRYGSKDLMCYFLRNQYFLSHVY